MFEKKSFQHKFDLNKCRCTFKPTYCDKSVQERLNKEYVCFLHETNINESAAKKNVGRETNPKVFNRSMYFGQVSNFKRFDKLRFVVVFH